MPPSASGSIGRVRTASSEDELRSAMHGVRSVEVVRALRPDLDSVVEAEAIERREAEDVAGLRAIPGAADALRALREERVAVVTSATRDLAAARLGAVGIELPAVAVYAGDVSRGKPDPEGYLTAAKRLGVDPAEALVVEDSPPGIEAGRAAGAGDGRRYEHARSGGGDGGGCGDFVLGGAAQGAGRALRCVGCSRTTGIEGGIRWGTAALTGPRRKPRKGQRPRILRDGRRRTALWRHDRPCRRGGGHGDSGVLRHRLRPGPALPVDGASTLARSMGPIALFGIENSGLALAVNLLLLFLVVIWLRWSTGPTRRPPPDRRPDARGVRHGRVAVPVHRDDRLSDRPAAGVPRRRPRARARDGRRAGPARQLEHQHCQYCGFETEKSFLRCPSCLRRLKEPCTVCGKPLDPRWKICPYCEAEVGQAAEGRRPRPRRAAAPAAGRRAKAAPRATARPRAARQRRPRPAERPARASRDRPQSAG